MTRKIAGICLALVLLLAAATVQAQNKSKKKSTKKETEQMEAPPVVETLEETRIEETMPLDTTDAPNDELTAAIKELMTLTGAMNLGKQMGKNLIEMDKSAQSQLPPEFFERMYKEFDSEQTNRWMINAIVKVYREKFTLEEVIAITAFYNTPVGKKTISVLPQIMQESMKAGENIGRYLGMKVYQGLVKDGLLK